MFAEFILAVKTFWYILLKYLYDIALKEDFGAPKIPNCFLHGILTRLLNCAWISISKHYSSSPDHRITRRTFDSILHYTKYLHRLPYSYYGWF